MADAQTLTPSDNFDAAFASFSTEAPPATPQKEDVSAPTSESPAEPAPAPAETPAAEQPAAPEAEQAPAEAAGGEAEETGEDADEDTPAPISDADLLARFAALVKQAEPVKQEQPAPAQQQAQPQPEATPVYTAEEKEFLDTYEKDWPDVAKAEALRRRAEYREIVGHVFREIARELQPIAETVRILSERTQLQELTSTISDYEDVRDKVIDWAQKQPAYLQAAYKHVIEQGTVDEVRDLIDRYKRDTGTAQPAPATPAQKKTELPAATKQAAAALAPVSSKRSAVIQSTDPNDFESAFKDFAEKFNL